MGYNLTGVTVSGSYGRLVQVIHGSPDLYYDGFGNLLDLGVGTVSIGPQGPTGPQGNASTVTGPTGPQGNASTVTGPTGPQEIGRAHV